MLSSVFCGVLSECQCVLCGNGGEVNAFAVLGEKGIGSGAVTGQRAVVCSPSARVL